MKKKLYFIAIFVIVTLVTLDFAADHFNPRRLNLQDFEPAFTEKCSVDENTLKSILSKQFVYLGKGRQSFVFVSEDGKDVIKFFNSNYFCLPVWLRHMAFPNKELKKNRKLELYFKAHVLAFQKFKEESGLIAVHLPAQDHISGFLNVKDKLGRSQKIDLAKVPFVLQKRMQPLSEAFCEFRKNGQIHLGIDKVIALFKTRSDKRLGDEDYEVVQNVGFIEGQATLLDAGRLFSDEKSRDDLLRHLQPFRKFVEENYPDDLTYLDSQVEQLLK